MGYQAFKLSTSNVQETQASPDDTVAHNAQTNPQGCWIPLHRFPKLWQSIQARVCPLSLLHANMSTPSNAR